MQIKKIVLPQKVGSKSLTVAHFCWLNTGTLPQLQASFKVSLHYSNSITFTARGGFSVNAI